MKKKIIIFFTLCFLAQGCAAANLKYSDNKHVMDASAAINEINYNSDRVTDYKFQWKINFKSGDFQINSVAYLITKAQNQFVFHAYTMQGHPLVSAASSINEISFIDFRQKKYAKISTSGFFFAVKQMQRFLPFFAYLRTPDTLNIFPEENKAVFLYNYEGAEVRVEIDIKEKKIMRTAVDAQGMKFLFSFSDYKEINDFFIPQKMTAAYGETFLTFVLTGAEELQINSDMLYLSIPKDFERIND